MYITYILKSNIGHGSMPQVSEGVSFTINTASGKVENLLIGNHPVDSSKTYQTSNDRLLYWSLSFFVENKDTNNSVTAVLRVFKSFFFPFKRVAITDLISCHTSGRAINEKEMV